MMNGRNVIQVCRFVSQAMKIVRKELKVANLDSSQMMNGGSVTNLLKNMQLLMHNLAKKTKMMKNARQDLKAEHLI